MNFLRRIFHSDLIPHPLKYIPWALVKGLKLKAPAEFKLEVPGKEPLSLSGTDTHFQLWYWWGMKAHEYDTVKLVTALSQDIRSFWDVGAYFGQYSLILSRLNPEAQVIAFEPSPETREKFELQVSANSLNVKVSPYAVSDTSGTLEFYNQKDNSSNSSLHTKRKKGAEVIQVDVRPLDQVAKDLQIQHLDLIKVDVEHNELNVLKGMREVIHRHRPMIIMEVLSAFPSAEAEAILVPENYQFYLITTDGLVSLQSLKRPSKETPWRWKQRTPFYNFLFCPVEKVPLLKASSSILEAK